MKKTFQVTTLLVIALLSLVSCNLFAKKYSVTYYGNGNTGGSVPVDTQQYVEGDTVTILGNTGSLAKTGYTFGGWNSAAGGSGTNYAPGSTLTMGAANVTLYANWAERTSAFAALSDGIAASISDFNSKTVIYSILSRAPSSRTEGNSIGSAAETSFYLRSTTGTSSMIAEAADSLAKSTGIRQSDGVYGDGQTASDEKMRQVEEELLASGSAQLTGNSARSVKAAPTSISVGTSWNDVYIVQTGNTIDTTCRYVSSDAYFFVDNRDTAAMSAYLAGYGTAFDTITDVNHSKFGQENDVDGNGKVIIVFSEELSGGLLGYFYSVDKFPKTTYSDSNEGDIFYMTTTAAYQGNIIKGTLAHEFQHMIYFDQHYNNGVTNTYTWLNEALSQAAEYYNGYTDNHLAWIKSFLGSDWPGLSLTYWTSNNYGYGAIFIRYLIDQYGDTAIKNMCSTGKVGIAAVEDATGASFNTIFSNFTKALVMSGTGDSSDTRFNFQTLDLQLLQPNGRGGLLPYSTVCSAGTNYTGVLYPYEVAFNQWSGTFGTMTLSGSDFSGTAFGLSQ